MTQTAWLCCISSFRRTTARKEFHDWRQQSAYLADAALFEENDVNLGGMRIGSRAHVAQTSWNFFSVLGTQPVLGSGFAADEDVDGTGWGLPGRNAVAVIGYGLWQQLFGGDPKVSGRYDSNRRKAADRCRRRAAGIRLSGQGRSLEAGCVQPRQQWLGNCRAAETGHHVAAGACRVCRGGRAPVAETGSESTIPTCARA